MCVPIAETSFVHDDKRPLAHGDKKQLSLVLALLQEMK